MPIKKGNTTIGAIYKGTTQIAKVYKGTKLLFENAVWLDYYFSNLYHDLVPETVSSKSVKNKAKVSKIYGNGVLENQLVQNGDFSNGNTGWTAEYGSLSVANKIGTFIASASISGSARIQQNISIISGHQYLLKCFIKTSSGSSFCWRTSGGQTILNETTTANVEKNTKIMFTASANATILYLYCNYNSVMQQGDTAQYREIMLIDLTQMFGSGNEPTTLTDNRIQALLNRGYIPYNAGTYKGTDIGEFSTTKTDTTSLDVLSFKYQGNGAINSHDTMEITKDNVVFTKNMGRYTFTGSETFTFVTYPGNGYYEYYTPITGMKSGTAMDGLCDKFQMVKTGFSSLSAQSVSFGYNNDNNLLFFPNTNVLADVQSRITGATIYYPLATPQVITIPRKYMGVVDLGSLSWGYTTANGHSVFYTTGVRTGNNYAVYCSQYLYDAGSIANNQIRNDTYFGPDYLYITDDRYTDATTFKNAMSGVYLFYETENEVADILDTLDIEAGGTITTDSEVLPNVEFKVKCK